MKVKELIKELEKFDGETLVARLGHDGGYENIYSIEKIDLNDNFTKEHKTVEAVVID